MADSSRRTTAYVGRFAPSPTGPLHFGSLMAALASYLDARANNGTWLLRMEDLDPPREPEGAAEQILQQLHDLNLRWDGEVLYQSSRLQAYEAALEYLKEKNLCFPCNCTRPRIKAMGPVYDGNCRGRTDFKTADTAIRIRTDSIAIEFLDPVYGNFKQYLHTDAGDFVVKRKDGLFAYQLAVVIDDAHQGITDVVRGSDLLDSTPRQIYLQQILGLQEIDYCHIPVLVNNDGQKLSKQHFAEAIDSSNGSRLIYQALQLLGQKPASVIQHSNVGTQLEWGIEHWDIQAVPKLANITLKPLG